MRIDKLEFYEDDEGTAVDVILAAFNVSPVQSIKLGSEEADDKMKSEIDFLIENQANFLLKINEEAKKYSTRVYGRGVEDLTLVKVYLSPDEDFSYGFMFTTKLDSEHGIGVKFAALEMKKIGSSETAFL